MFVFLSIAGVGLLFLAISALFGDAGDHEVAVEMAHEVEIGEHPGPFSLRVLAVFLTAFGAAGGMARLYGMGYTAASSIGMGAGLVCGFIAWKLLAFFMAQQVSSGLDSEDLVGRLGEVSVAIPAGGTGQVRVEVNGKRLHPMAHAAAAGASFSEGDQVRVVRSSGATVYVERASDAPAAGKQ